MTVESHSGSPPLPDRLEMLATSRWAQQRPGLAEVAQEWIRGVPQRRQALAVEAQELARPRMNAASASALARAAGRTIASAAPEATITLLTAASAAFGSRVRPPRDAVTLRRARRLVRSGGPAYVKLGQFIATADGLLPPEWVRAFAWCRDRVPALAPGVAESVIARELGAPAQVFRRFDPVPMAAASIAQVHAAELADGTEVVVKVRRPGLRTAFIDDIRVMAVLAAAAERVSAAARAANATGFVELFAQLVLEELDLRLEAANMVELGLAGEHAGMDYCLFPRPIPGLVSEQVIVMERVPGVPYTEAREHYGDRLDSRRLLRLSIQGVLEHTLVYGLFHGDLHAGNFFIVDGSHFALIDFGICARLDADQRSALVRLMVAFAQGDVGRQIRAMSEFGALPPGVDLDVLSRQLNEERHRMAERLGLDLDNPGSFDAALGIDDLAESMGSIMRVLVRNHFRLPKELVLFFKNLLYLNGFTESVAPDANLLGEIDPIFAYFTAKYPQEIMLMTGGD